MWCPFSETGHLVSVIYHQDIKYEAIEQEDGHQANLIGVYFFCQDHTIVRPGCVHLIFIWNFANAQALIEGWSHVRNNDSRCQ